ncbi:MAG: PhoH family protein [Calditrichaeota bacterium]|nr:PhoH family protein [Calditrichota bacterium]
MRDSPPTELLIEVADDVAPRLLGVGESHLRRIEERVQTSLGARGSRIYMRGPAAELEKLRRVFTDLEALCRDREEVTDADLDTILNLAGLGTPLAPRSGKNGGEFVKSEGVGASTSDSLRKSGERGDPRSYDGANGIVFESPRGTIRPRGAHQERYVHLMEQMTVVFAIGPAGTGKTYLAVAKAVDAFQRRQVDKIILVRPVVESGETLGFLPGDILEKVDPYFRPLYDALGDMISVERMRRFIDRGMIEIAPLAYMRGRTLNNAFVILDEAQNTTSGQMKMFLTRLGASSRAVLTGDRTQIDLPDPGKSGLIEAESILQGIQGIGFIEFDQGDVVRHPLVADILKAYEKKDEG